MPTTLRIVDHPAVGWSESKVTTAEELLKGVWPKQYRRTQKIVQTSFTRSQLGTSHVSASENGFVWAAYHAYSMHHHLVIRPEDVWFAILTQLSFFINANAEQLRGFFVNHQGQKELHVFSAHADFGALAVRMTSLIAKNVVDPQLREWVMPSFTTTTDTDRIVGAVLFMGAMQKYFTYGMTITCGLPSVTLLGVVEDWQEILDRLDKVDLLGEEPQQFAKMLRPILQHIILSFEDPTNTKVTHFWNTIVHRNPVGSGTDYLSGWLTSFCYWDSKGEAKPSNHILDFTDVAFPIVEINKIPAGFASVPVAVDDNGNKFSATMVAGSVGISASIRDTSSVSLLNGEHETAVHDQSTEEAPNERIRNTVQPVTGWWMCENEAQAQVEARELEMKQLSEDLKDDSNGPDSLRKLFRLGELLAY